MGHIIERIALERGNTITCRIDRDNPGDFDSEAFLSSDVAIEFSTPGTAPDNLLRCFRRGIPVVCGTTGWTARLDEFRQLCDDGEGTLLWASNFSVGVNLFRAISRSLARMMDAFPQYRPRMEEVHHVHKLDHPSGTAVTLAEDIVAECSRMSAWAEPEEGRELPEDILGVDHIRRGEVPGIHTILWESPVDEISITHSARNREGFALGAVMAAEWLAGRKGFRNIGEMLRDVTGIDPE